MNQVTCLFKIKEKLIKFVRASFSKLLSLLYELPIDHSQYLLTS